MNKNVLILIIIGLFLMSFASANNVTTIIAGNNYTFSIDTTDSLYWDVVGNSSNMDGFEVYQDIYDAYSNITFVTDYRMRPDSFTIILFSEKTKEVIKEVEVGGGTKTKTKKEYVDNYITRYKDRIIKDYEEIQRLNDEMEKIRDNLDKREKKFAFLFLCFIVLLCIILLFINKLLSNKLKKLKGNNQMLNNKLRNRELKGGKKKR